MRKVARWIALALVVVTALLGPINVIDEIGDGETLLQQTVGAAVAVYTIASWLALIGLWRRRRWAIGAAAVWGVAATWAATVATYAFGDAPPAAVAAPFVSCALMTAWVVWAVRDTLDAQHAAPVAASAPRV